MITEYLILQHLYPAFLFVIGLVVMIFSLMGGQLKDATYDTGTVSVVNESGAYINSTGYKLAELSNYLNDRNYQIDEAYNVSNTSDVELIGAGNYTVDSNGVVYNATSTTYSDVNISYTFDYDESNTATDTMNDTTEGISGVTNWYDIFIVIGAMVVLILLTVIIITAIRNSGLMTQQGGA